jgi:hypothetical protein
LYTGRCDINSNILIQELVVFGIINTGIGFVSL